MRCRDVTAAVVSRSLGDALLWSISFFRRHPSVVLLFAGVSLVPGLVTRLTGGWVGAGAVVGLTSTLCARGYVGVLGQAALRDRSVSAAGVIRNVAERLPALAGALLFLTGIATVAVLGAVNALAPVVSEVARFVGVPVLVGDVAGLLAAAAALFVLSVKFVFVPDACFVGGYGPLSSLWVSWELTTVHRRRVLVLVGGFVCLLGLGVVVNTQLRDPNSPLALTIRYRETTLVLRSFGVSDGGVQAVLDVVLRATYSGLFLHQYVQAILLNGDPRGS